MFGKKLREFREKRQMTLRELGTKANMDYILLNKVELGLRLPPQLDGIMALADAMNLDPTEFEQLLDEATDNGPAGARFTADEVARIKQSTSAYVFFTRRTQDEEN